jgi:hypothetical protein
MVAKKPTTWSFEDSVSLPYVVFHFLHTSHFSIYLLFRVISVESLHE